MNIYLKHLTLTLWPFLFATSFIMCMCNLTKFVWITVKKYATNSTALLQSTSNKYKAANVLTPCPLDQKISWCCIKTWHYDVEFVYRNYFYFMSQIFCVQLHVLYDYLCTNGIFLVQLNLNKFYLMDEIWLRNLVRTTQISLLYIIFMPWSHCKSFRKVLLKGKYLFKILIPSVLYVLICLDDSK